MRTNLTRHKSYDVLIKVWKPKRKIGGNIFSVYLSLTGENYFLESDIYEAEISDTVIGALQSLDQIADGSSDNIKFFNKSIKSIGTDLWDRILPSGLKTKLGEFREKLEGEKRISGELPTLCIISDDTWIPWEILNSCDGTPGLKNFFCENFAFTRWIIPFHRPNANPRLEYPPQNVNVKNIYIVAAMLEKDKQSTHATDEITEIKSLFGQSNIDVYEEDCSECVPVIETIEKWEHSIYHVICHGGSHWRSLRRTTDPYYLDWLELNDDHLHPFHIPNNISNCSPAYFVFLNACHTGMMKTKVNSGASGWPTRWIKSGCGVLIAPLYSVRDESAKLFASRLYHYLLIDKKTLGEAVYLARVDVRADGDPTWLAYACYGDPMARLIKPDAPS